MTLETRDLPAWKSSRLIRVPSSSKAFAKAVMDWIESITDVVTNDYALPPVRLKTILAKCQRIRDIINDQHDDKEPEKPSAETIMRYPLEAETIMRYPLELDASLHICLWSTDGKRKWTIAYFHRGEYCYDLHFIGDRPLNDRVNWMDFRDLITHGQRIANDRDSAKS